MQGANTDARGRDKCKVRTPMQDGGANTNANSNGPKRQRMTMCAVSVLLFMFSLLLVLCFCVVASVSADVASVFDAVVFARSLAGSLSP